MKASMLLTILTSASASLCCIVPVFGLIGGASSLVSSVLWLEPFRPYMIHHLIPAAKNFPGRSWTSSILIHSPWRRL